MRRKVTVVGAGNVGATAAQEIARRDYADVVLVDIKEGLPQGKALDIDQAASVLGYEPSVVGSNGYEETKGSDVVVVTAGVPRTGEMSRDDLVTINEGIVGSVTREVVRVFARRDPDRRLEPARRHVPRGQERLRLAARAGLRDGRHPRHRALQRLHRHGDRRLDQGRDRDGARRPRRPDGARGLGDDRRRRPAHEARLGGQDRGDGRAHPQGRRRDREAPRHLGLVRARRRGGADGRLDRARPEARPARAPRCSRASTASTTSTWACP